MCDLEDPRLQVVAMSAAQALAERFPGKEDPLGLRREQAEAWAVPFLQRVVSVFLTKVGCDATRPPVAISVQAGVSGGSGGGSGGLASAVEAMGIGSDATLRGSRGSYINVDLSQPPAVSVASPSSTNTYTNVEPLAVGLDSAGTYSSPNPTGLPPSHFGLAGVGPVSSGGAGGAGTLKSRRSTSASTLTAGPLAGTDESSGAAGGDPSAMYSQVNKSVKRPSGAASASTSPRTTPMPAADPALYPSGASASRSSAPPQRYENTLVGDSPHGGSFDGELAMQGFYHGVLLSQEAGKMVEESGNGAFLVRRSETHQSSLVLCLNWLGTALHLRLQSHPEDGTYSLCGVRFRSILGLVAFFKDTPFPTTPAQAGQVVTLTRPVMRSK